MRPFLTFGFVAWAALGLIYCGYEVLWAHGRSELGVGTSAAVAMDIALWTGGLVMFGIGAALSAPGADAPGRAPDSGRPSLAQLAASVSDAEMTSPRRRDR